MSQFVRDPMDPMGLMEPVDPIWGTPATCLFSRNEAYHNQGGQIYDSPRCGGRYAFPYSKDYHFSIDQKCLLTSWLIEQRRKGTECPIITRQVVKDMEQGKRSPMSIPDRAEGILTHIYLEADGKLGKSVDYRHSRMGRLRVIETPPEEKRYYELLAYSESTRYEELVELKEYLENEGWIKSFDTGESLLRLSLTVKGCMRLKEIIETNEDSSIKMDQAQNAASANTADDEAVTVFISYSWDSEDHKEWVKDLAIKLRNDGIDATLDQWELALGDQLTHFMEKKIRESKYVLIICTPDYCEKSNHRKGGVGYEDHVMTAEVYQKENHRKFIPILAKGSWEDATPSWLLGKCRIDLSTPESSEKYEKEYLKLKSTLLGEGPTPPPVRRSSANG